MKRHTIYIGLNDQTTKKQEIDDRAAFAALAEMVTRTCGGGTISPAQGIYKHAGGAIVVENSLRAEIMGAADDVIMALCEEVKKFYNQESVLLAVEAVEVMFV